MVSGQYWLISEYGGISPADIQIDIAVNGKNIVTYTPGGPKLLREITSDLVVGTNNVLFNVRPYAGTGGTAAAPAAQLRIYAGRGTMKDGSVSLENPLIFDRPLDAPRQSSQTLLLDVK